MEAGCDHGAAHHHIQGPWSAGSYHVSEGQGGHTEKDHADDLATLLNLTV
jgi:hypothetical protein